MFKKLMTMAVCASTIAFGTTTASASTAVPSGHKLPSKGGKFTVRTIKSGGDRKATVTVTVTEADPVDGEQLISVTATLDGQTVSFTSEADITVNDDGSISVEAEGITFGTDGGRDGVVTIKLDIDADDFKGKHAADIRGSIETTKNPGAQNLHGQTKKKDN